MLGTGSDNQPTGWEEDESGFYDTENYARAVETANGLEADSYHPIAVTYDRRNLNTMIDVMYQLPLPLCKITLLPVLWGGLARGWLTVVVLWCAELL